MSLATALQLNCASNPDALTDEMLAISRPSNVAATSTEEHSETLGIQKDGKRKRYNKGLGLDDSDDVIVDHMKSLIGERQRRDYDIEHRNLSWSRYFFRIFKRGYFYLFGDGEISPVAQVVVSNTEDDDLSAKKPSSGKAPIGVSKIDILSKMKFDSSMVYAQGDINSCTANAIGFIIRYWSVKNGKQPTNFSKTNPDLLNPSRLYHYCNSRLITGKCGNVGVSAEHAILAIDKYGTCPEDIMTIQTTIKSTIKELTQEVKVGLGYPVKKKDFLLSLSYPVDNPFAPSGTSDPKVVDRTDLTLDQVVAVKPTLETYRLAFDANYSGLSSGTANPYAFVSQKTRYDYLGSDAVKFKAALTSGYPIFWGAKIYSAFTSDANDYDPAKGENPKPLFVPMPTELFNGTAQTSAGGHAMVIVGWGDYNRDEPRKNYFRVLNSWGQNWSDCGFCYFPEEYITGSTSVSDGTVATTDAAGASTPNTVSAYAVYFK